MSIHVGQYRGISLGSKIIKFVTRKKYSHSAAFVIPTEIIEAWEGDDQVRIIKSLSDGHTPGTSVDIYEIPCSSAEEAVFYGFIMEQVGKKYDRGGLKGFLFNNRRKHDPDKWFCSELIAQACKEAGIRLFADSVQSWQVSPGMITISPLPIYKRSMVTT